MGQKVRQWLWKGARNIPVRALNGGAGSKKIVFLYVRSHQLIENKGRRARNEAKNEAKIDLNEAKLEAKKSKNSALCAKRSEDAQPKGEGFSEPNGGYMKVEFEARALGASSRPEGEKGWWTAKSTSGSTTPDLASGRRGIVFLVAGCKAGLSISGHKVRNGPRPEIPPCVFSSVR